MKRILAIFLILAMLMSLTACIGEPDPNVGKYLGIRGEMNGIVLTMEELYPGESYLELKNGGKADLVLEGDQISGKWTLDGEDFNLVVEGYHCPGTLKDGVIVFEFGDSGITLTFAMDGVEVPEPQIEALEMGFYPLYAVDQDGEYTDNETIKMIGLDQTNYLICYGDGTVEVVMESEQYFCSYNETSIIDDEGGEIRYAIVDGLVELYLEGNMTFYYQLGDIEDIPDVVPSAESAAFPVDVAEAFYGDWHGWCLIMDGTGDYEDEIGYEFEMLARYAFDDAGNITPWMAIYSDSEDNFQNISLYYNESDQFVYLSGQLFGMEILSTSQMYETYGSLCLTLYLQSQYGTADIVVCMRHPDAEWDAYDYPCMPEDAQKFYRGMTFEERVELYELDPADLPELS